MRKIVFVLLTALIHFSLLAQKTGDTYSFEFKNVDKLKAIETIKAENP